MIEESFFLEREKVQKIKQQQQQNEACHLFFLCHGQQIKTE